MSDDFTDTRGNVTDECCKGKKALVSEGLILRRAGQSGGPGKTFRGVMLDP